MVYNSVIVLFFDVFCFFAAFVVFPLGKHHLGATPFSLRRGGNQHGPAARAKLCKQLVRWGQQNAWQRHRQFGGIIYQPAINYTKLSQLWIKFFGNTAILHPCFSLYQLVHDPFRLL